MNLFCLQDRFRRAARVRRQIGLAAMVLFFGAACARIGDPGPPAADEVLFLPSGQDYERQPQVVRGEQSPRRMDLVRFSSGTVAEAAQVYADFSGKEVRVAKDLIERKLGTRPAERQVAASYVVQALESELQHSGVEVAPLGRKVVAFRSADPAGKRPRMATEEEQAAATAAMSEDRFWMLIRLARVLGSKDCDSLTDRLRWMLTTLSPAGILGFKLRFEERMIEAYRWDLWAVAYIVNGGCSDDGFADFRGWLISQGRGYFEAAMRDPASAADRAGPAVFGTECEQMLYVAYRAFEDKTGGVLPWLRLPYRLEPAGEAWTEEQLPELFPEVMERFSWRFLQIPTPLVAP